MSAEDARPRRERLDLGTIAIVCLVVAALASTILPPPWPIIVTAAAIATVLAVTLSRVVWPAPSSPTWGVARRRVEDRLDALHAMGFTEDEARGVMRTAVIAAVERGEAIK